MYLVHRRTKPDCIVDIFYDRFTGKYCFVNLTSMHVCSCRFTTPEEALKDMDHQHEVLSYEQID